MRRLVRRCGRLGRASLAYLLLAGLVGTGAGALAAPRPAAAETIRDLSWYLDAMHVERAQRLARGDDVTVAVVDTGVDAGHPDLRGQVLDGAEVGDESGEPATGDGQDDQDGHGTGMSSLIAGRGGGANSVLGVAPGAKILPVKITQTADGSFHPADVYRGVRWAIDHGADVVNMSLGGERSLDAPWKRELIDYATEKDAVLIAAAGNVEQGDDRVAEPASIRGVVAVSGVNRDGEFWSGSAKGPEVVVCAPAEKLPLAVPTSVSESGYAIADGTSGATALVSGVAALIRSAWPDMKAHNVVNRLIRTAEDRGPGGRDEEYGFGVVDARAALEGDVPGVKRDPLVSPEPEKSKPAAGIESRRIGSQALLVVGGFVGMGLFLLLVAYLLYLARRSRQVVVAGVAPGVGPVQMSGGAVWGGPPGAGSFAAPGAGWQPSAPGGYPGPGAMPPGAPPYPAGPGYGVPAAPGHPAVGLTPWHPQQGSGPGTPHGAAPGTQPGSAPGTPNGAIPGTPPPAGSQGAGDQALRGPVAGLYSQTGDLPQVPKQPPAPQRSARSNPVRRGPAGPRLVGPPIGPSRAKPPPDPPSNPPSGDPPWPSYD